MSSKQTERLLARLETLGSDYGKDSPESVQCEVALAVSRQADAVERRNELLEELNASAAENHKKMNAAADAITKGMPDAD